ncbi:MAG: hypothetical protein OHK0019_00780 [Saprospiraceae bacterium]
MILHTEVLTPDEAHRKAAEMLQDAATIRTQRKQMRKFENALKKQAFQLLGIEVFRLS